jgi:hypothetical protein
MKNQKTVTTVATLTAAADLVRSVTQAVVGNEIADSFRGNELTSQAIGDLALSQFQKQQQAKIGGL